jgi:hypothetical protein
VPPAIRWEIDTADDFDTLEDLTARRLCWTFGVEEPHELTRVARSYCENYHRALVEPFVENRRWYMLLRNAQASWPDIFRSFPNLEEIGVGCCERIRHPSCTYTNVFVARHGNDVLSEVEPLYAEDSTVNMGWASAVVLASAPSSVRSLQLSIANFDNFNSFATVNRLLSIVYRDTMFLTEDPPLNITKLSITLRGIDGVHGQPEWSSDTGSAGLLRYWEKVISSLVGLKHLEFRQDMNSDPNLAFTSGENTKPMGNVVVSVLSQINHPRLETLQLHDFKIASTTLSNLFQDTDFIRSPCLQTVLLDNIRLSLYTALDEDLDDGRQSYLAHTQGMGWMNTCNCIARSLPGVTTVLKNPSSNIGLYMEKNCRLNPTFTEQIRGLPRVTLDNTSYYTAPVRQAPKNMEELFPTGPS